MKHLMLAAPAVVLCAAAAMAQTDPAPEPAPEPAPTAITEAPAEVVTGGIYGTEWPLSVGSTFFTDATGATLRSRDELSTGWQSLPQAERDMILADCAVFMTDRGAAAAEAPTDSASDPAPTATETAEADAAAATSMAVGYDEARMQAICEAAQGL